jgi:hypothetical protein
MESKATKRESEQEKDQMELRVKALCGRECMKL